MRFVWGTTWGSISQKTAFFVVTAMKTSNLAIPGLFSVTENLRNPTDKTVKSCSEFFSGPWEHSWGVLIIQQCCSCLIFPTVHLRQVVTYIYSLNRSVQWHKWYTAHSPILFCTGPLIYRKDIGARGSLFRHYGAGRKIAGSNSSKLIELFI
jgi:hypothetical protein